MRDPGNFTRFQFSSNPEIAVAHHAGNVVAVDPKTQQIDRVLVPNRSSVHRICVSDDGTRLAAWADKFIKVWDTKTGEQLHEIPIPEIGVAAMTFFSDGKRLLLGLHDSTAVVLAIE